MSPRKYATGVKARTVAAKLLAAEERGYQKGYRAGERDGYAAGRDSAMQPVVERLPARPAKQTKRQRGARIAKPLTFEQFKASGRYVADLSKALPEFYEASTPGRVYAGELVIERSRGCAEGEWMLTIENISRCAKRFRSLERDLYEWGRDEGILSDSKQLKGNRK
jgi:hypothetical protein